MTQPKYTLGTKATLSILKDGHTILQEDVIRDLNRNSHAKLERIIGAMALHIKDLRQRDGWSNYGMDYPVEKIIEDFQQLPEEE